MFQVMETDFNSIEVMQAMITDGLQNSLSDATVGVLFTKTAVLGTYFNVKINAKNIKDRDFSEYILTKSEHIYQQTFIIKNDKVAYINSNM